MRKIALLIMVTLLVLVGTVGAQEASEDLSITVYNQGTALIRDQRTLEFVTGTSTVDFTDVAASIDRTSVHLVSLSDPDGTFVLEQNFLYDLVDSGALLNRYLEETIEVVTIFDGEQFTGQLLSAAGSDIILREEDGRVVSVDRQYIRDIRFPSLPDGLITRPTLRWLVQSATGGAQQVELTYLTSGINWSADYNILLGDADNSLGINGWITLNNNSGTSFDNAQLKLVAGDVNRLPQAQPEVMAFAADAVRAQAAPQVQQREFFEYQLYEIQRRVTINNNETKQVEFVNANDVAATKFFVYDGSVPFYGYGGPIYDQGYGQTGITDVNIFLEFSTGEESGLGQDLPAGRVRVFQEDVDGSALLIGEDFIDHTPEGETIQLQLGNAFDLVGERQQTNFQFIGSNVLEETWEIRLRNRKDDETVQIRVPERLSRWSNWEIIEASHDYTKVNSNSIEFRVDVAPGEEQVITYTVRYEFPR